VDALHGLARDAAMLLTMTVMMAVVKIEGK
jgi:hypothetical protein